MRVSDIERQRTIDELRRHCAAGRLDVDEYAVRIEKAMLATTLEELDILTTDLPFLRIADPAGYRSTNGSARTAGDRGPAAAIGAAARDWADGRASGGFGRGASGAVATRLSATAVVLVTVAVVVTAVLLALALSWTWAAVLLAGWLAGVVQGRISQRPHPRR
jgi:Domain of unknown function (DUF1707)